MKPVSAQATEIARTSEFGRLSWTALSLLCIGLPLGLMVLGYELSQRQGAHSPHTVWFSVAEINALADLLLADDDRDADSAGGSLELARKLGQRAPIGFSGEYGDDAQFEPGVALPARFRGAALAINTATQGDRSQFRNSPDVFQYGRPIDPASYIHRTLR